MKLLFLLSCLLSITIYSSAVNLECNFNAHQYYSTVGSAYRCEITTNLNIKSPEEAIIEDVSGTHMSGKTNDDVLVFNAESKVIDYFPKGLEKFFKNLKVIRISIGQIKQISQSDLKPFPDLIFLQLDSNNVEILEDGLFDNHPNMQVVWFNANKIIHVGKNVFNNMNKITWLGFGSNSCIDTYANEKSSKAIAIIDSLKTKCFDANFEKISQNLANNENESKTLTFDTFPVWRQKLENLEKEFKSSRFSHLSIMKERFQALQNLKESKCCFASNSANLDCLLTDALSKTEHNLKNSLTSTCSANGIKLQSLNEKIFKVDQNILKVEGKVTNFDQKFSNFPQLTEKLVNLDQEVLNLGKEFAKLSVNQKDIRNDISKLDEGMFTLLEASSTESDKIEKNHYDLEDKVSRLDEKISKIEDKFSSFEEKLEQKLLNIENKLDKIFKNMRNY